ncbi:MAG: glutamate 5-kinase, partial [Candidatus Dormibacteria bacterium]
TDEISLGENDRLGALVATLIGADLLVILTDAAGVLSADPRLNVEAALIEEVAVVDAQLESAAGPGGPEGSGGMASKVAAAKIASWSGIPCVIAGAAEPDAVRRALSGEAVGTRIRARERRLGARKVWIAFARPSRGRLVVDAGAVMALRSGGRSLLPVGIIEVHGDFQAGDAVEILDIDHRLVAKGLASCAQPLLQAAAGLPGKNLPPDFPGEAVHRSDLVVLSD